MVAAREPMLARADAQEPREVQELRRENRMLKVAVAACTAAGGFYGLSQGPASVSPASSPVRAAASTNPAVAPEFLATPAQAAREAAGARSAEDDIVIPEFFDTREKWLGCGTYVVDQGQCGDCWAASATNVMGDRVCIHFKEDGQPIEQEQNGAFGMGAQARLLQQAGKCIGNGTMGMAHEHGCKRGAFFLSPQALVSCGNMNNTLPPRFNPYKEGSGYKSGHTLYPSSTGCNGGEAQDAWRYMYHEGLTVMDSTQLAGCTPYTSGHCAKNDPMNNGCHPCDFRQCTDTGLAPEVYTVDSFGWIMEEDLPERGFWNFDVEGFTKKGTDKYRPVEQRAAMERQVRKMQIEMMTNGPLHTCIDDYANFGLFFNQYPMGIYNSTEGTPQTGGHCIELMGWGTDRATGMPYWTWKNSWGTNFANGGFARFIRGVDLVGIESDVWTGCPSGSFCKLTDGVVRNETWVPNHAYFPYPPTNPFPRNRSKSSSASRPSRSWPGGKEMELTRKDFSHPLIAPLVTAAVRSVLGNDLGKDEALAKAQRVWTRSVRGMKVRVQVEGSESHGHAIRHMEGHTTTL